MSMITNLLVSIARPIRMPKYLRPNTPEANKWMGEHSNSPNGLSYLAVSGLGLAAASIVLGLLGIKGDNETSKTIGGAGTVAAVACLGLDYISRHTDLLNKLSPNGSQDDTSSKDSQDGVYRSHPRTFRTPISVTSRSGSYSGYGT